MTSAADHDATKIRDGLYGEWPLEGDDGALAALDALQAQAETADRFDDEAERKGLLAAEWKVQHDEMKAERDAALDREAGTQDALDSMRAERDRFEAKLEADDEAWAAAAAELERLRNAEAERGALDDQIMAIRQAAVEHGVNDEVGAAIAHAELVARVQRRRVDKANL